MPQQSLHQASPWRQKVGRHYSLINLIGFKVNWVLLVGFQNSALLPALAIYAGLVLISPAPRRILEQTVPLALTGIVLDSLLSVLNLFRFDTLFIPAWLALLWFSFALALPYGLHFLRRWPLPLQALTGACASISYLAGWQLGAVVFPQPVWLTGVTIACIWALLLPLFLWWMDREKPGRLRETKT